MQILSKLIVFLLLHIFMSNCFQGGFKRQCQTDVGCHNAFPSCIMTFAMIIEGRDELNTFCAQRAISCKVYCEKCERDSLDGKNPKCETKQYKPFFGFAGELKHYNDYLDY